MKTLISKSKLTTYFNFPKTRVFWFPLLGTITEYYDYALYGFTAVLLSQLYFPVTDPTVSLLKTYVVFALGSAAKPLGALLFGWIGDLRGRKIALQWTMLGIFIPTTVIGLLPTYQEWGVSATIILILCRLFQGMFLSGETDGTRITLYESFLKDRPALLNCLVGLSCHIGIFLASFAVSLTPLSAQTNAWRLPYLIGGVLGLGVFVLRRSLAESVDYLNYRRLLPETSLKSKISIRAFLGTILMCGSVGGLYQLFFVFLGAYLSKILGLLSISQVQKLTPLMLFAHIITQIGAAWLTDHGSPKKVIAGGIYLTIPLILILAYQLSCHFVCVELLISIAITTAFIATPGFNLILRSVGVGQRYRFVSMGHALGSVLLSGSTPAMSLLLWQQTQLEIAPLFHALILCGCAGGAIMLLDRSKVA